MPAVILYSIVSGFCYRSPDDFAPDKRLEKKNEDPRFGGLCGVENAGLEKEKQSRSADVEWGAGMAQDKDLENSFMIFRSMSYGLMMTETSLSSSSLWYHPPA
ncbi:hypothetical protein RvY_07804 [Ramazzottius varieornatus]|uniref:Uncharacterized protein n=1 Tax=Ramazzottius varieornatus TaxID=947166 RepID=A0A1D1V6F7_RAMVA|nr:hypothetical protein RvY_07804 [Ramazzottius varieornatus]